MRSTRRFKDIAVMSFTPVLMPQSVQPHSSQVDDVEPLDFGQASPGCQCWIVKRGQRLGVFAGQSTIEFADGSAFLKL
jgi:hypothetical protein